MQSDLNQVVNAPNIVTKFWMAAILGAGTCVTGYLSLLNAIDRQAERYDEVMIIVREVSNNQRDMQIENSAIRVQVENNSMELEYHEGRLNTMGKKK